MAFIDSPEAVKIASKISDGTVTIGEFLLAATYEITNQGRHQGKTGNLLTKNINPLTNTFKKTLPKLNLSFDSPWSSMFDIDVLRDFDDFKEVSSATLVHIQTLEKYAESFYDNHKRLIDEPNIYPYGNKATTITGPGNLYRRKVGSKKGSQTRGTDKLKGVPKAETTISKLLKVVNKIPSDDPKNVKAAILFNILMPYRPGEVAGLRLSDVDFEEGVIAEWSRGQKTRNNLVLSKTALAILKDAAEKAKNHPANKGVNDIRIFPTLTSQNMTSALTKAGFKKDFKTHEATLGRELKGVKDLRKLLPSLLAHELGANIEVVSEILGHKDIGDINMSLAHYISPVQTDELASTRALRTLENLIGFHVGATTLNDVPTIFGVSADSDFVNAKEVIDVEDPRDFRATEAAVDRPVTPEDIERRENFLARQDARVLEQTEESLLGAEKAKTERLRLAKEINPQNVAEAQLAKIDEKAAVNEILQQEYAKIDAIAPEDRDPVQVNRHAELSRVLKVKPEAPELKEPSYAVDDKTTEEMIAQAKDPTKNGSRNWLRLTSKIGRKIPLIGSIIGAGAAVSEALAESKFQKRTDITEEDRKKSEERMMIDTLQAGEELASPSPVTTMDAEEIQRDTEKARMLESIPLYEQIQQDIGTVTEEKVGRSGPPLKERRARVDARRLQKEKLDELSGLKGQIESDVEGQLNPRQSSLKEKEDLVQKYAGFLR